MISENPRPWPTSESETGGLAKARPELHPERTGAGEVGTTTKTDSERARRNSLVLPLALLHRRWSLSVEGLSGLSLHGFVSPASFTATSSGFFFFSAGGCHSFHLFRLVCLVAALDVRFPPIAIRSLPALPFPKPLPC